MSHRLPSFMFARGRPGLGFLPDHQTMCANDNSETGTRRRGSPSCSVSRMVETTYLSTPTSVIHQPLVQRSYRLFASCIPSRSRSAIGIVFFHLLPRPRGRPGGDGDDHRRGLQAFSCNSNSICVRSIKQWDECGSDHFRARLAEHGTEPRRFLVGGLRRCGGRHQSGENVLATLGAPIGH